MKIDAPLDTLTSAAIEELFTRQIMEGPRLDYKLVLFPLNDASKAEILKDVCALANSEGGHLVYGIRQDEDGKPEKLEPFEINGVDRVHNWIDNVLNDLIEDRIPGVRHRAIEAENGLYYYIIRVPASPLAPHMIKMPVTSPRFFQRFNTVSAPMTVRQIKDRVLQVEHAIDAATTFVDSRIKHLSREYESFSIIQIVPLYSQPYQLDLTDQAVYRQLSRLGSGNPRHCIDGYTIEWSAPNTHTHTLITRSGSVELFRAPVERLYEDAIPVLAGTALENRALEFMGSIRGTPLAGLAELPALLSFAIVSRKGFRMWGNGNYTLDTVVTEQMLHPDPTIIYDWTDLEMTMKRFFDVLWQAFGAPSSPNYDHMGQRIA